MKTKLLIFSLIALIPSVIVSVFAQCLVNEDWPDAPCLDHIINGYYDQREIDRWAGYYQYKGTSFMEQKRMEMDQAINEKTLKEWVNESVQNRNVYAYYFFSGRAPDIREYDGQFGKFMINESPTIHDPYYDDERLRMASEKIFKLEESNAGGSGTPIFDSYTIMIALMVIIPTGVGVGIGLTFQWKKQK